MITNPTILGSLTLTVVTFYLRVKSESVHLAIWVHRFEIANQFIVGLDHCRRIGVLSEQDFRLFSPSQFIYKLFWEAKD